MVQRDRATSAAAGFELLESKLRPPWSRRGLVPRVSLVDRLLCTEAPIVAVLAPPGYGKTTVLAQWSLLNERRTAWVSLDERDNDPGVLLSYLAAALDRVAPIDPTLRRSLASPAVEHAELLHRLVVVLAAMRDRFALVLDHVEVIRDQRCRDVIAEVALNLPPGSQLALASRTEPPIPIVRLRAQGWIAEIGAEHLAMDRGEARELLAAADVELSEDHLSDLLRRTEGWPVGLYLATLAAKADAARPQVVLAQGDDRLMADYLRSEVLARLPPTTSAFLTRTSVLEQLSGPLCDAVTGGQGSRRILETLETDNLLLIPLDRQREWYRYHHLLRDLLRVELTRSEPDLVPRLHDRAAAWFETNGQPADAIDHAQAAGDADRAARLVASLHQRTSAAGRRATSLRWMEWFDARGVIERYPHLAVLAAVNEALIGHTAGAERWADAAALGAESFAGPLPDGSTIEIWIALLEAALCRRGVAHMRADAERARDRLPAGRPWCGPALFMIGMSQLLAGDDHATVDSTLGRAIEVSLRMGIMPTAAAASAERAVVAIERHDWAVASTYAAEAVAIVRQGNLDGYMYATIVEAVAARTALHEGDVTLAKEHAVRAARLRPLCSAAAPFSGHFLLQLAHADLELADPTGAQAVVRQVRDILHERPDLGTLSTMADELERMLVTIRTGPAGASSLTAAELRLVPLLATHLSYAEIGQRLFVSRNTVKTHSMSIFRKLGVSSRSEAIERAEEIGLLGS
jgi:LuxR family maltose regulon positive regulatory protein